MAPKPASRLKVKLATRNALAREIVACTLCAEHLPLGPRPVVSFQRNSKVLIVGQAPGTRVHETGIPWNDPSGERLRAWLGVDAESFYDARNFAIVPMGFCYPGRAGSGDAPPRPECAQTWMQRVRDYFGELRLTLLIGSYAQAWYLGDRRAKTLTATVQRWRDYAPEFFVLPHPSPRNNIWLKKNPWFERETLPALRRATTRALQFSR